MKSTYYVQKNILQQSIYASRKSSLQNKDLYRMGKVLQWTRAVYCWTTKYCRLSKQPQKLSHAIVDLILISLLIVNYIYHVVHAYNSLSTSTSSRLSLYMGDPNLIFAHREALLMHCVYTFGALTIWLIKAVTMWLTFVMPQMNNTV